MTKFQETFEKWCELNRQLAKDCKEYLKEILEKLPDNSCSINEDYSICVCYDGGNHPEYDSNCFSNVESVYLKDGDIYLDIEDASGYPLDYINAEQIYDVADAVEQTILSDVDIED